jgi:RNA polymerase-binding transcription factor DksA
MIKNCTVILRKNSDSKSCDNPHKEPHVKVLCFNCSELIPNERVRALAEVKLCIECQKDFETHSRKQVDY